MTTDSAGSPYLSFYPASSATAATVQNPAPAQSGAAYIQGVITVVGYSAPPTKIRRARLSLDELEHEEEQLAYENEFATDDEDKQDKYPKSPFELRRKMRMRRSTGCMFIISENGTTIYSLDLDSVPQNESIHFNTSSYNATNATDIDYVEQCPPGVTFPQLKVAGLQYVVGPTASNSSNSSGSVIYVTSTYTQPGSTRTVTSVSVSSGQNVTATQTTTLPGTTVVTTMMMTVTETATATATTTAPGPTQTVVTTSVSDVFSTIVTTSDVGTATVFLTTTSDEVSIE